LVTRNAQKSDKIQTLSETASQNPGALRKKKKKNYNPMKLYIANKKYSSWSLRPWVLCKALGITFEEVLVGIQGNANGSGNTSLLTVSPSGLVPCLSTPDGPVWDSLAISEYLYEMEPKVWPRERAARAFARCIAAEMHSGFPDIRSQMSMNIAYVLPAPYPVEEGSRLQTQIKRIESIWAEARSRFGEPSGEGPFLFGSFCAADAMYAPIAYRFQTYGVVLENPLAKSYVTSLLALPAMREWEASALEETTSIVAYDEHVLKLGGVARRGGV